MLLLVACGPRTEQALTSGEPAPQVINAAYLPKAKNVIFLIGDGMGLTQITAGMYHNNNKTSLEDFPIVGLHKCHSYDDLVTDSAAGATAFASGVKTVNGAIGMDHMGATRETILEEAERKGLSTGLVASSTIVHATPAAFIAHVPNRRLYEEIALDFMDTEIDVMIGGGKAFFTRREDGKDLYEDLRSRNYQVNDYLDNELKNITLPENSNFAYFSADKDPLPRAQGRDYMIPATKMTLEFLSNRSPKGFFVMIEGSQIDWGGHANNAEYVLDEFDEFDRVIKICREFAEDNGETLVIVTADHETGGLSINPESTMRKLNTSFSTGGHTATLIPVFAYGPGAERFSGIYDNTEIYKKLRQAYGWKK
jgi:alkaline phosphatase